MKPYLLLFLMIVPLFSCSNDTPVTPSETLTLQDIHFGVSQTIFKYSGNPITLTFTKIYYLNEKKKKIDVPEEDFIFDYVDNVNVGKATCNITSSKYSGSNKVEFNITPAEVGVSTYDDFIEKLGNTNYNVINYGTEDDLEMDEVNTKDNIIIPEGKTVHLYRKDFKNKYKLTINGTLYLNNATIFINKNSVYVSSTGKILLQNWTDLINTTTSFQNDGEIYNYTTVFYANYCYDEGCAITGNSVGKVISGTSDFIDKFQRIAPLESKIEFYYNNLELNDNREITYTGEELKPYLKYVDTIQGQERTISGADLLDHFDIIYEGEDYINNGKKTFKLKSKDESVWFNGELDLTYNIISPLFYLEDDTKYQQHKDLGSVSINDFATLLKNENYTHYLFQTNYEITSSIMGEISSEYIIETTNSFVDSTYPTLTINGIDNKGKIVNAKNAILTLKDFSNDDGVIVNEGTINFYGSEGSLKNVSGSGTINYISE